MIVPPHILIGIFLCTAATFIYLRFVAREIHRREKYLERRMQDKIAEWEKKQKRQLEDNEEGSSEIVTLAEAVPDETAPAETDTADIEAQAA